MVQSINRTRPPDAIRQQAELARLIAEQQQAIATGRRVERASDDPQAWLEISILSRHQSNEAAWTANLGRAETTAAQAEASFDSIANELVRAKEIMIQANGGALAPGDREGLALEIEAIAANLDDVLGQRDSFGGALFAAGDAIEMPIGFDRHVVAAPAMAEIVENIDIGGGATGTLQQILTAAVAAVRSNSSADRSAQLAPLDNAIERMANLLTRQGAARGTLEETRGQYMESRIALAERRSQLEEIDISEAVSRLQSLLVSLEAAQAVHARIAQRSLVEFLG